MAEDKKNPVSTSESSEPRKTSPSEQTAGGTKPTSGPRDVESSATQRVGNEVGQTAGLTSPGTKDDVERQGFTGTHVQQQQQASAGATSEDVPKEFPLFEQVLKQQHARPGTKRYTVADAKFNFGGEKFARGETIYLTDEEAQRIYKHLEQSEQLRQTRLTLPPARHPQLEPSEAEKHAAEKQREADRAKAAVR